MGCGPVIHQVVIFGPTEIECVLLPMTCLSAGPTDGALSNTDGGSVQSYMISVQRRRVKPGN